MLIKPNTEEVEEVHHSLPAGLDNRPVAEDSRLAAVAEAVCYTPLAVDHSHLVDRNRLVEEDRHSRLAVGIHLHIRLAGEVDRHILLVEVEEHCSSRPWCRKMSQ